MKIKIAFFKGDKKTWLHRFIRWYTRSPYSHAELIMPDGEQWVGISPFLTSRVGIREKRISLENQEQNWDYLTFSLNWRPPVREYQINQLNKFIQKTLGSRYDWIGLIVSNLTPFLVKKRDRWYCSEWIAHALVNARIVMWDDMDLYDTPEMSPGKLYELLLIHADQAE
tara:strand:+ start:619 stop:1125 length:507 start_codon:yes stop_codon:yes gene_type:complete